MGAGEDREELLFPLVQAVERQLTARLREGAAPEDCGPAFPLAAAMVVLYGWRVDNQAGDWSRQP